jgi:hypothetical protein
MLPREEVGGITSIAMPGSIVEKKSLKLEAVRWNILI